MCVSDGFFASKEISTINSNTTPFAHVIFIFVVITVDLVIVGRGYVVCPVSSSTICALTVMVF